MANVLRFRVLVIACVLVGANACGNDSPMQPSPPVQFRVISVAPNIGPSGQATPIRINGTGFREGATLMLDNVATPSTYISSTLITATAPPRAVGPIDVVVTNPGGQASRLERGFTYILVTTRLTISGNRTLFAVGDTTQFTATAEFHDGSTSDVTAESRWETSTPEVVSLTQTGLVTARTLGLASISARHPATGNAQTSRFASAQIAITPPGTFIIQGRVREPGAGGIPGARVLQIATGQSLLTPASGVFSMGGVTDGRLSVTKDGFEPVDVTGVDVTAEENNFTDVPMQRVTRVEPGSAPMSDFLAPNDVEYRVNAETLCQPCRMIRIASATSGMVRVRITWTDVPSTLNLWLNGQMFPPTATREIVTDLPVTGGVDLQVYLGKIRGPVANYVQYTFAVTPLNPEPER